MNVLREATQYIEMKFVNAKADKFVRVIECLSNAYKRIVTINFMSTSVKL